MRPTWTPKGALEASKRPLGAENCFRELFGAILDPPKCPFDICVTFSGGPCGTPQKCRFDIFLFYIFRYFPRGPKSTPPGPHLTFCFDDVGHFPGTLQNWHFDMFLTFSKISGKSPDTLGSAHYGSKGWQPCTGQSAFMWQQQANMQMLTSIKKIRDK